MTSRRKQTNFRVIGGTPMRHDATDKVTGRAQYGADVRLPGMLYGAILRSPHAHARILSVDTSQAARLPGVRAVVTSADLPDVESKTADLGEGTINLRYQSSNILARDRACISVMLSPPWRRLILTRLRKLPR
jgi:xanthine dehydrogenase molybdenum-binding subunit